MVIRAALLAPLLLLHALPLAAQNQTREIVRLADNVYAAIYSEHRVDPVEGNSLIVIRGDGVTVLDAGRTPATAREVIAEIRALTDKPVTRLINSHWHDDHIFGNAGYQDAFPGIEILAHAATRDHMRDHVIPTVKDYGAEYWTKIAADVEAILAKGTTSTGAPLSEAQKSRLGAQAATARAFVEKLPELRVVLPTATITESITLPADVIETRILYLGPGNTRGDLAVYLPKQKILATGDLLVYPVPFAYGSTIAEWIATLKALRAIDADIIVPGHGPVMRDKSYLDQVIALFESLVAQVGENVAKGATLEETKKAVNLRSFRTAMAGDDPVRNGVFADSILRVALEQAYAAAGGKKN